MGQGASKNYLCLGLSGTQIDLPRSRKLRDPVVPYFAVHVKQLMFGSLRRLDQLLARNCHHDTVAKCARLQSDQANFHGAVAKWKILIGCHGKGSARRAKFEVFL